MRKAGYSGRDPITHRTYSRGAAVRRFMRTGQFSYRGTKVGGKVIYGLGHKAGEQWGDEKGVDPYSPETKYSKNSPSFDEGVYMSKVKRMAAMMKQ